MTKAEFMALLNFPEEWETLGMYPEELFKWQLAGYELGHEDGSEHDRNGAFHWWLTRSPSKKQLEHLLRLTYLDSDALLGDDVRGYIRKAKASDSELSDLEKKLASTKQ
jgi:hypothetical protein